MLNYQNDTIMKKMFFALMVMLTTTMTASAMSYEQARSEALFLTDKMAYELNLTDEQYEAAYEINLDYLMGVTGRADVFGTYWERRNLDLSYILLDWQWNAYMAASYFYRPLYWEAGYWHFGIYRRYPHRDYFFFGRPHFYATYRGGHAWHVHGGHGYYYGHRDHFRAPHREHFGMHDRWNRGDFRGPNHSSTRITGRPGGNPGGSHGGRIGNNTPGNNRPSNGGGSVNRRPNNSFGGSYGGNRPNSGSYGGSYGSRPNSGSHSSSPNVNRAPSRITESTHMGSGVRQGSNSGHGGFTSRPSSGSGSFSGGSHSSGTRSGGGSFSGGSRGGGSHSSGSHGGGSHGGGGHFGGHR